MSKFRYVLSALLVVFCASFLSACQPTPEAPPFLSRSDGLPEGALADPVPDGKEREVDAPEQWTEKLLRSDGKVVIDADVNLDIPAISNIPVIEMLQKPLKNEDVQALVKYFCGTESVYKVPDLTVSELEKMIGFLEEGEHFTISQRNWSDEILFNLRGRLDIAKDSVVKEKCNLFFDVPTLPDDVYIGGESWRKNKDPITEEKAFIDVMAETGEDGIGSRIQARTYNKNAGTYSSFVYTRGIVSPPEAQRLDRFYLDWYEDAADTTYKNLNKILFTEQWYREEESERLRLIDQISQSAGISSDDAQVLAINCLNDLGIEDMVLADCEYAIQYLTDEYYQYRFDKRDVDFSSAKGGYYLTFFRGAGDIPSCRITFGAVLVNEYTNEKLPTAPPFYSEYITIFVTDEGIQQFGWFNIGEPVRTVAENVNLLPFDTVKKAMADYTAAVSIRATSSGESLEYRVEKVSLRYAYQTAYNAPDRAWMVPVWVFQMRCYMIIPDGGTMRNIDVDLQIGALDGIPIIPEEYGMILNDG